MTLADVLKGIASAFGVAWRKENDAFLMHNSGKNDLELQIIRLGDWEFIASSVEKRMEKEALGAEILQHFGQQKLEEGITFFALPQELQDRFIKLHKEDFIIGGTMSYYKAAPSTIENSVLKIQFPAQPLREEKTGLINWGRTVIPHLRTPSGNILLHLPIR
ncbi:MAG TPA: hypothetical protein VGB77_11755 [Abditibacteriaceae bacterium]|jgi:hypothetical protein